MSRIKAIVTLSPGEVGFYDELSKIHLTITRPEGKVYEHTNTAGLIRGVRSRAIRLKAGSLSPSLISEKQEMPVRVKAPEAVIKTEPIVEAIAETVVDPIVETVAEEKATKKKKGKNKEA